MINLKDAFEEKKTQRDDLWDILDSINERLLKQKDAAGLNLEKLEVLIKEVDELQWKMWDLADND